MACVNPDGTLSPTAKKVMRAVAKPLTLAEISQQSMVPVFMLRGRIRELLEAGYVKQDGDKFQATEAGAAKA